MVKPSPCRVASDLTHPLPLAAVALLVVNDHLLKGAGILPGWLTGKLSDVAGLFFFPVLLVALARSRGTPRTAWIAALATAAGFTMVKLAPPVNACVARLWGAMVMDPSDLLALPATIASACWMTRPARTMAPAERYEGALAKARRAVGVTAAAFASMATSAPAPRLAPSATGTDGGQTRCATLRAVACTWEDPFRTHFTVEGQNDRDAPCDLTVTEVQEVLRPATLESTTSLDPPIHARIAPHTAATFDLIVPRARPFADERGGSPTHVLLCVHETDEGSAPAFEGEEWIRAECHSSAPQGEPR